MIRTESFRSPRTRRSIPPATLLGRTGLAFACLLAAAPILAQEPGAPPADTTALADTLEAEPVVVTVTRVEEEALQNPRAVSVVRGEDIQLAQRTLTLDEALSRVPGTFAQNRNNFSIGERLSIRGFGARAAFGIRGIRLVVDGIPQTLADGQSVSSNIDLASAGRIEVLRGPSSSLYGNAAGGVVDITTEAPPPSPTVSTKFTAGKFDLQKYQLGLAGRSAALGYVLDANRTDYNGFRGHSRVESTLLNGRLTWDPDESSRWALVLNYNDTPVAESPGSLTRAQADSAPGQGNPRNVATASGESHQQLQGGLSYNRELTNNRALFARVYALDRAIDNPLPFAVIQLERFAGGGGLQLTDRTPLFGMGNRLTAGVDLDLQSDDRLNFENAFPERPGEPGEATLDQDEQVTSLGVYVQDEAYLAADLELTLGVRYDRVRFDVEDRLLENGDDSGERTLEDVSPMAGLRYSPAPAVNLYANVATSFQTPTTTELANRPTGEGGFNEELEPQTATSYEVGVKGLLGERVSYELAGFLVDVRDELIPFEAPGQEQRQFFRNAGSSQHNGIEASLSARPAPFLRALVAYTYSNFFFEEFATAEAEFDGNDIPGVPPHRLFAQLGWEADLFAVAEAEVVDEYFVDDANTATNEGYTVVSLRGGWSGDIAGIEWRPFIGINNVFDEEYSGSVVVNAVGARYYEPSPGRNVYGGLGVAYRF
ncbi:MAG: TonB-dependent receptor family protein [Gemmatimonadota bacterium]